MTNPSTITRRNFFRSIMAPALAVAVVSVAASTTFVSTADARSASFNKGHKAGMAKGRKDGYADGYRGAYKASYVDEMINGGSRGFASALQDDDGMNWAEYRAGYKIGYRKGYKAGYASGQREGGSDGRTDAQDWKADLREEMNNCMKYGNC